MLCIVSGIDRNFHWEEGIYIIYIYPKELAYFHKKSYFIFSITGKMYKVYKKKGHRGMHPL